MDYTVQDGTLWFNTWKIIALIVNMVYGLSDSKAIYKINKDDSRGVDNTKIKVAGKVKGKS